MGLLKALGTGQGYLKAGFLGFAGSGKTYTATQLAVGTRAFMKQDGPIAMFDTEGGSEYIAALVREATGKDLLGIKSRSLDDLLQVARECEKAAVSVLLVDSMTHIWRDVCDSYLTQMNKYRASKGWGPRKSLEFQDWNPIKAKFAEWTDYYLNSPLHIIICGRAGYDYDYDTNEETGKKELVKTGTKMKTEAEFGFEPSLLIEMEKMENRQAGKRAGAIVRRATIIKDRFDLIDGKQFDNPTFDHFKPHIARLVPGAHAPIDTSIKTDLGVGEDGDAQWQAERKRRVIACEEIQAELLGKFPGQSAQEKYAKATLIKHIFNTGSWTKVESLDARVLHEGLAKLRNLLADADAVKDVLAAEQANAA